MVSLIIYAVMAAGALFAVHAAWSGFKDHISAPYVQAQIESDQKVVSAANKAQAAAESERDNARSDTAACVVSAKKQSDSIADAERRAKVALDASRALRQQQMRDATAAAPVIADLQARAAAAPKLMVCTDELAKAKYILREALRARRGMPSTPPVVTPGLVK